eukprot:5885346-Amphidinium_carterae.3
MEAVHLQMQSTLTFRSHLQQPRSGTHWNDQSQIRRCKHRDLGLLQRMLEGGTVVLLRARVYRQLSAAHHGRRTSEQSRTR